MTMRISGNMSEEVNPLILVIAQSVNHPLSWSDVHKKHRKETKTAKRSQNLWAFSLNQKLFDSFEYFTSPFKYYLTISIGFNS